VRRRQLRDSESGQALLTVAALVVVIGLTLTAVQISVVGNIRLAGYVTSGEQALQAAHSGLADFEAWVDGYSGGTWTYAYKYCSPGTSAATNFCPAGATSPDSNNPAYSALPDPHCSTSLANATAGAPGSPTYWGWETVRGNTGTSDVSEQFQYVIDSSQASAAGGYVHVFVTGRAGTSGKYSCRTIKALFDGPDTLPVNTSIVAPTSCNGQPIQVTAPSQAGLGIAYVKIQATGGTGQSGGDGGLAFGGAPGGVGQAVTATYAATAGESLWVNNGCQGGDVDQLTLGGPGFAPGGSLPSSADAGGGGGATAVCATASCYATAISSTSLGASVYAVAGGGGGGGESWLIAPGGTGGSGGSASTHSVQVGASTVGVENDGLAGNNGFLSTGGSAGANTYSSAGGNGNQTGIGGDGGGGGGGFQGGGGGSTGWSGGGGGSGSSFYNTTAGLGYLASSGSFGGGSNPYGSVTITWESASQVAIGQPISPALCGAGGYRDVAVGPGSLVTLSAAGGNGGNGDNQSFLWGSGGTGGSGTSVTAAYKNTTTAAVYLTAIQGCSGVVGADDGGDPGGFGLGNGGFNVQCGTPPPSGNCGTPNGASGSGGGASAVCVGSSPTANNCTGQSSALVVAAGGGGGSEIGLCNEKNSGGAGGLGVNWGGGSSATQPSTGIVSGGSGGNGGSPGGSTYSPNGGAGTYGPGIIILGTKVGGVDGGAGAGGYQGGGGGSAGNDGFLCLIGIVTPGGGNGGSSYVATSNGGMQLQQCPNLGAYPACTVLSGLPNLSGQSINEVLWQPSPANSNGTVSVTQKSQTEPSGVISTTLGTVGSTTW